VEYVSSDGEGSKADKLKNNSWSRVNSREMMEAKTTKVYKVIDDVKSCKGELGRLQALASVHLTFLFDPD
jgi:hypothetical protein